jgi:predicted acetyltransferase
MTELATPDVRLRASWFEAMEEFGGAHIDGAGLDDTDLAPLRDPGAFARFVGRLVADALPESPRKAGWVPCTFRWIMDGDTVVGSIAVRHSLNDYLLDQGGHIGYSVRPSRRRRGHASRALAQALRIAADLGIDRVLVTCDEDNIASRRTIERNGGVYEDSRQGKRRYWIDVAPGGVRGVSGRGG